MAILLHIDTSAAFCSVAVSRGDELVHHVLSGQKYDHSSTITLQIEQCLKEAGIGKNKIQAVSISTGPGSFTGLRIGTAAAKGFCYGLDIPLIGVDTLTSLARRAAIEYEIAENDFIAPVIDARRMEVYTAVFNNKIEKLTNTYPLIIEESSFHEYLNGNKVFIIGDAADKCKKTLNFPHFQFDNTINPSGLNLIPIAYEKFLKADFDNIINYEPFYLKGVNITVSNKNIL